jgi:hypothetical protein
MRLPRGVQGYLFPDLVVCLVEVVMPLQTTDLRDFKLLVRNAYHNLELVKQVLQSGTRLIEQQLDQDEQHRKATILPPSSEAALATAGDEDAKARELMRLAALPTTARFTTDEAALYLNCSTSLLRTWRWQGRGPSFEEQGRMVRYSKGNLDKFMA